MPGDGDGSTTGDIVDVVQVYHIDMCVCDHVIVM